MPTTCCPQFDPAVYDGKEFDFSNRYFIKGRVTSLFHFPLNIGAVIGRLTEQASTASVLAEPMFSLADENSLWGADWLVETTRSLPGADNALVTGRWLAKVFEGSYGKMGEWMKEMNADLARRGHKPGRMLTHYATCPKCAKERGKNYVVLFGEV